MSSKSTNVVRLKLLVDKENQKVLFAEAGKDFVDFLFTLLSLPIGTVIRLLSKNGMVGALGKLYNSVENLSETYIQPNVSKDTLLKPKMLIGSGVGSPLLLLPSSTNSTSEKNRSISIEASFVTSPKAAASASEKAGTLGEGSYVKGLVTYMVMDDLEVKPLSTIFSISVLNQFNVKEAGRLEEKTVSLATNEGLKLLEASLRSSTVLTDVFLVKKASRKR
ncbi:hypothetical protein TIFTF001_026429 [Ficus carica]|uniref:DUF674 family protein n=1 Tax=Ficus carica TaxID=3494 RepID=A0AA88DLD6_FICCA|nr:hypothetical protein TIFTF001_026429 [Ficus carica]